MTGLAGLVAGVDGCKGGWLVVICEAGTRRAARMEIASSFRDVLEITIGVGMIAIDIPIGLPERSGVGGRAADIAARAGLGARQSTVFAVPARAAVMETDYRAACAVALRNSDPPRKVSKQTFNLFAKMREVDALMTPALQARVVECHPEAAFVALNGGLALALPKKVKSRPFEAGLELRRGLLVSAGFERAFVEAPSARSSVAGRDDLLDACACAWSAARVLAGTAHRYPADPPRDAKGLHQEIWA